MIEQPKKESGKGLPNPLCELFGGCEYGTKCAEEGCIYTQQADLEDFEKIALNISGLPVRFREELRDRFRGKLDYDRIAGLFQGFSDERMGMVGLGEQ